MKDKAHWEKELAFSTKEVKRLSKPSKHDIEGERLRALDFEKFCVRFYTKKLESYED